MFDNGCLTQRVSRELALDSFPMLSRLLQCDAAAAPAVMHLGARSSRRSTSATMAMMGTADAPRYPYFYQRSNDMESRDIETILRLGSMRGLPID